MEIIKKKDMDGENLVLDRFVTTIMNMVDSFLDDLPACVKECDEDEFTYNLYINLLAKLRFMAVGFCMEKDISVYAMQSEVDQFFSSIMKSFVESVEKENPVD